MKETHITRFVVLVLCCTGALLPSTAVCEKDSVLRIILPNAPAELDPHLDPTSVGDAIFLNVYESLLTYDADGKAKPVLAMSWRQSGLNTWEFQLRPNITFHDGRPCAARDAVASINRARLHPRSENRVLLQNVRDVTAPGEMIVAVTLNGPDAVFLKRLSGIAIVPADSPEAISTPVGTGPYRVVDSSTRRSIRLEAFSDYWGTPAALKRAELIFEEDREGAVNQLLSGAADMVTTLSPAAVAKVEMSDQLWVESSLGSLVYFLALNESRPPFQNELLREAVEFALDRDHIAEEVFLNYARPAGQMVNESAYGHAPELGPVVPSTARARALVSVVRDDGPIEFTLEYMVGNEALAKEIKRQLELVDLTVHLQPRSWHELLDRLLKGELETAIFTWRSDLIDVGFTFDQLFHSGSSTNPALGTSDEIIDELIVACRSLEEPEERLQLLHSITERTAHRRVLVPLVWVMDLYGVRRDLDWKPQPSGVIELASISKRDQ